MSRITITCCRCKKAVDGIRTEKFTGGFYDTGPNSSWHKYANPGEVVVCDACMHADPRYRADYSMPTPKVYRHRFDIVIQADDFRGAMDALWSMWTAFQKEELPLGGSCPEAMGNAYSYEVKATNTSVKVSEIDVAQGSPGS